MLDIHSHILPGIDDGSTSMQMTLEMLKYAKQAGISMIVASPHYRSRDMNRRKVLEIFSEVQMKLMLFWHSTPTWV